MHDLSIVTDTLRQILTTALNASPVFGGGPPPFSVNVSGQHPQTPSGSDCELSLYLFHISPDKFLANSFWTQASQSGGGVGKQPVAFEPLALDLWYMLSSQSQGSFVQEQQVLSVAMQAFHEHATVALPTPTPLPNPVLPSEATLTLESPSFDELSRLWESLGVPLRTTAQYRVSVVFLTPDDVPAAAPPVTEFSLTAAPADPVDDPSLPRLLATRRTVSYVGPDGSTTTFGQSPATTAPAPAAETGQTVELDGLMLADSDRILLVAYDASGVPTETDVTGTWKRAITPPYPSPPAHGVPFLLRPPLAASVPPGRYELTVSRPSLPGWRARGVPINVAAWVNPAGGPLLNDAAGVFTLAVRNVATTGASLRLGSVQLRRIADGGVPLAGEWQHSANTITFVAPADTPVGQHQIGLRVGDVESDPALWAVV